MARITMVVHADGTILTEVSGAEGPDCLDRIETAKRLAPGAVIVQSQTTEEFDRVRDVHQERTMGYERDDR